VGAYGVGFGFGLTPVVGIGKIAMREGYAYWSDPLDPMPVDSVQAIHSPDLGINFQSFRSQLSAPAVLDELSRKWISLDVSACEEALRFDRVGMVPAMIERTRQLQAERGLHNIEWVAGQSTDLPFPGATFDCVVTRFSFHHFLEPLAAPREMKRVCKPWWPMYRRAKRPRHASIIGKLCAILRTFMRSQSKNFALWLAILYPSPQSTKSEPIPAQ
jgi:SAM-dependent methyltransferase